MVNDEDSGFFRYNFFLANYLLHNERNLEAQAILSSDRNLNNSNLLIRQAENFLLAQKNKKVKISIPPTLLISSVGIIKDYNDLLSIVPRKFGDLIFIIGKTNSEMCGSEYEKVFGYENGSIPKVDKDIAKRNYNNFIKANKKQLINSAISIGLGGAAVSLAKMSIASQMGLKIDLSNIQKTNRKIKSTHILFSESQSRIITTISPSNRKEFETYFEKTQLSFIGKVIKSKKITFNDFYQSNLSNIFGEFTR